MSAHTSAPWYALAEGVTDAAIGHRAIIDSDGYTVCNPSPMGEANARLIAAAPELLEALIALLNVESAALHGARTSAANDGLDVLYHFAAARAAIAKATGENV
jgi:hypothetical protein